jgi:hypothetical protein
MKSLAAVIATLSVLVGLALMPGSSSLAQVNGSGADWVPVGLAVPNLSSATEGIIDEVALSDAELQDLRLLADQKGMSLQAAIDRYAWNDDFAQTVSQIRALAPESFAGAEILDAGNARVAFTGAAPAVALALVEAFSAEHRSVSVDMITGSGVSESDLETAVESAHYAVLGQAGIRDATTSFDDDARRITVLVALEAGVPAEALDALRVVATTAVAEAGVGHVLDTIQLSVVRSDTPEVGGNDASTEHLGGELVNGPRWGCTSGFVVVNAAGTRGVTTAGHCEDHLTDDGVALVFRAAHEGAHGDFQWHTGPRPMPRSFYAGSATATEVNRRNVTAVGAPVVGQSLCKNGRTNHAQCQEVRRLNVCSGRYCSLVQMGARLAAGGDSGGPIYWGHTAYGLHQGWHFDPVRPFDRDLFSRADLLPRALGVSVVRG